MKKADKFSFNFNVDDDWRWNIGENQIESIGKMKKNKNCHSILFPPIITFGCTHLAQKFVYTHTSKGGT